MEKVKRSESEDPVKEVSEPVAPDPEVPEKPRRRTFSAQYKLRILQEVEACESPGEIGSLLRREGLYQSHLTGWRRQREEGTLNALKSQKRGRKTKDRNPLARKVAELEQENRKLKESLKKAETIIEFQKKVSELLEIPLKEAKNEENDS